MTRRGFTLLELLVVIGIMGLLGTVSVGGYRAMQRGMAERGVMESVDHIIRAAYQRAQIDRQPTAVYFWNETLRAATEDMTEIVVGRAVAIRRSGRLSQVQGDTLFDEFADLNLTYQIGTTDPSDSGVKGQNESATRNKKNTMYLYPIDRLSDIQSAAQLKRSTVYQKVFSKDFTPMYLSSDNGTLQDNADNGEIKVYAFKVEDPGNVQWKPGMAYGCEFAHIELPHGFIFGNNYATDMNNPVREAGTLVFDVGRNSGNGVEGSSGIVGLTSITVSQLRPNSSGALSAEPIGKSNDPSKELN